MFELADSLHARRAGRVWANGQPINGPASSRRLTLAEACQVRVAHWLRLTAKRRSATGRRRQAGFGHISLDDEFHSSLLVRTDRSHEHLPDPRNPNAKLHGTAKAGRLHERSNGKARRPFYPDNFCFSRHAIVAGLNYILRPATSIRREALQKAGWQLDRDLHYVLDAEIWFGSLPLAIPIGSLSLSLASANTRAQRLRRAVGCVSWKFRGSPPNIQICN